MHPKAPFTTTIRLVRALFAIPVAFIVLLLAVTVSGSGGFLSDGPLCVENNAPGWSSQDSDGNPQNSDDWLKKFEKDTLPKVTLTNNSITICVHEPTFFQRVLGSLTALPTLLLYATLLFLLLQTLRSARRKEPFILEVLGKLRLIGWVLICGGLLASAIESIAQTALLAGLTKPDSILHPGLPEMLVEIPPDLSPGLPLCGLILLTVARILRPGATTPSREKAQEELA